MRLQKQYCYIITNQNLGRENFMLFTLFQNLYTRIILNTKYLKLMMQIEDYQPLNQDH